MSKKYILLTVAKNESKFLQRVIDSLANQTIKPALWLYLDDNSTDNSLQLVEQNKTKHKWIQIAKFPKKGKRDLLFHYAEICVYGFNKLLQQASKKKLAYSYIGLLDGDIMLQNNYYELLISEFEKDKTKGILSGGIYYYNKHSELILEKRHKDNPSGGARLWKKSVFTKTKGYSITPSPDTVANIKSSNLGFKNEQISNIKAIQLRRTNSAQGFWKGYLNVGKANYYLGYPTKIAFLKSLKLTTQYPFYKGVAYLKGYLSFKLKNKITTDKELLIYFKSKRISNYLKKYFKRK